MHNKINFLAPIFLIVNVFHGVSGLNLGGRQENKSPVPACFAGYFRERGWSEKKANTAGISDLVKAEYYFNIFYSKINKLN